MNAYKNKSKNFNNLMAPLSTRNRETNFFKMQDSDVDNFRIKYNFL